MVWSYSINKLWHLLDFAYGNLIQKPFVDTENVWICSYQGNSIFSEQNLQTINWKNMFIYPKVLLLIWKKYPNVFPWENYIQKFIMLVIMSCKIIT